MTDEQKQKMAAIDIVGLKRMDEKRAENLTEDYDDFNRRNEAFKLGYDAGLNARDEEVNIAINALKEIKAFWDDIDTPKPYFIGDKCDQALEALQHTSKKEVNE